MARMVVAWTLLLVIIHSVLVSGAAPEREDGATTARSATAAPHALGPRLAGSAGYSNRPADDCPANATECGERCMPARNTNASCCVPPADPAGSYWCRDPQASCCGGSYEHGWCCGGDSNVCCPDVVSCCSRKVTVIVTVAHGQKESPRFARVVVCAGPID